MLLKQIITLTFFTLQFNCADAAKITALNIINLETENWPGLVTSQAELRSVHFYTDDKQAILDACLKSQANEVIAFFSDATLVLRLANAAVDYSS